MKITVYNPKHPTLPSPSKGGLKSVVSFENDDFWKAMDICFRTTGEEKIVKLEIDNCGIIATFE